ncbi:hypothetical protein B0O80DRAFT_530359 [Mortierella sp. GBAus27b]|nr:hypothetical protein B0O80DRAFT_530359 [Mortierella sp. GBAus27b]
MRQHHHALNLPEVLFRIGRHLESPEDVVACSLVCKSFRASFEPCLWMNVHLEATLFRKRRVLYQDPLARFICLNGTVVPRQDTIAQGLQRMAPWIRSLAVHSHTFPRQLEFINRCTGINTLWIDGVPLNDQFDETYWSGCEALLTQNSACLRSLTLAGWGGRYDRNKDQPLWRPLTTCAQHINLTTLRIRESRLSERDLKALWGICRPLEILELQHLKMEDISTQFSHNSPSQVEQFSTSVAYSLTNETSTNSLTPATPTATTVRIPKLRELRVEGGYVRSYLQLEQILLHCPLIETLVWRVESAGSFMRRFHDYFAAQTWPCLDWIEISNGGRYVTDQEHARLIQSAPRPLRRLDIDIGSFGGHTFNLYREGGHFATMTRMALTELTFTASPSTPESSGIVVASKQVQEVLESCPMLEHISAVMITAQDIIQGKPWVCHRLKSFQVMINTQFSGNSDVQEGNRQRIKYSEEDKKKCHQIFEQLGQLRQLVALNTKLHQPDRISRFDIKITPLPFRLRMGLRCLSRLENLERIWCEGFQKIRMDEMDWMLEHWKRLQKILGSYISVKWPRGQEPKDDGRSMMAMKRQQRQELSMAQHHHALNLPEVIFRIGRHLESLDDVLACSLVCKSFRASFEPYLWMDVHLKSLHERNENVRRQELARYISLGGYIVWDEREKGRELRQDGIVQSLQRIAPWIRSLAVHAHCFPRQLRFSNQCTRINTLLIAGVPLNDQFDEAYWNDCETLLTQACLRSLTLRGWSRIYRVFLSCAQHTNLTTLRIRNSTLSARDLEALWKICLQLEILELTEVNVHGISNQSSHNNPSQVGHDLIFKEQFSTSVAHSLTNETSTNWSTPTFAATAVRLPKLRELTLDIYCMDDELQLEQIILHCPQLQVLIWNTWYSEPLMKLFCDHLAADTWPCLDWIAIRREKRRFTEQEHALLLQSAPRPLRRLDVDIRSFGEQTFNLYRERGHFTTLTKIDLTQSAFTLPSWMSGAAAINPVASKQVQEVLESCPMLEHIVAMVVTAQDIIQGKPWVCRRLKTFQVTINMEFSGNTWVREGQRTRLKYSEYDKARCHQIFEQLGQMSQLTLLDMRIQQQCWFRFFDAKTTSLPLRLRMGLGHLSTLRNLEIIGYYGSQRIRLVDLEWMLQHWNKLQKIAGDPLSVKWSTAHRGVLDERSKLVMRNLKAQDVQVALDIDARSFGVSRDSENYYGSDSESEKE